ncbi:type II secretion system F family protein [Corynebacterium flavescens]|uniref:Secretion system protein F n=1 Tax=Corynebacterium flavescens TaxID=28028 RepID=A0A1L7CJF2_CORFL|nr:type II secretion system F family protein [Corynebacterium flavescens]APT85994.1 secretion system protein F [Corynebacterium flavescens]KAA8724663.1 type II secretion system F family protein [Corynebacterium flavescens]MDN6099061.1 type II secretion system F family protein [Corynebacterium flavescens]MDN6199500.1 type II secretion system F family protein [Corynebacterium flavescens]MDN6235400.1 type II secretion system F family protein [Corynebacterium flavescens]
MLSLLLLAAALLVPSAPAAVRVAPRREPKSARDGPHRRSALVHRVRNRVQELRGTRGDPLAAAADIELFAACINSGLSTRQAAVALTRVSGPATVSAWNRLAALLGVGVDVSSAWAHMREEPYLGALASLVVMSDHSGAAITAGCQRIIATLRAEATAHATAAAERAGVFIAFPLAVCFLPAFIVLGLVPVVISLGAELF